MFNNLPAGLYEFACHPGIFERGASESDRIHAQREEELRWLTSRDLLDVVKKSRVCLVTYNALSPTLCHAVGGRSGNGSGPMTDGTSMRPIGC